MALANKFLHAVGGWVVAGAVLDLPTYAGATRCPEPSVTTDGNKVFLAAQKPVQVVVDYPDGSRWTSTVGMDERVLVKTLRKYVEMVSPFPVKEVGKMFGLPKRQRFVQIPSVPGALVTFNEMTYTLPAKRIWTQEIN
jgi:hypothetical protein